VAAPINGILQLPSKFKAGSRHKVRGFCEKQGNEVLRVLPPLMDPRTEMVVALVGSGLSRKGKPSPVLLMTDARFKSPVVAVGPGEKVIFRNSDSTVHILEPAAVAKGGQKLMAPLRIQSGNETTHAFAKDGVYKIRCSEVPHMQATVIVQAGALFQIPDATGSFRFSDVPPGAYSLRIWYRGKWVIKQSLKVKRGKGKLSMKVQLPRTLGKD